MRRTLRIRPLATADIDRATAYLLENNPPAATAFLDAIEAGLNMLAGQPAIGSPRYAHLLPGAALRMWPVPGFPYLIFYLERDGHIEVIRVLHGARDLPAILGDET